mmetsp:Transcript_676/g.1704  ORF Transcript_676/g.1704 Transcript_676/m.1704 type:complete len:206 (+) Transcript_676:672-1289(+)
MVAKLLLAGASRGRVGDPLPVHPIRPAVLVHALAIRALHVNAPRCVPPLVPCRQLGQRFGANHAACRAVPGGPVAAVTRHEVPRPRVPPAPQRLVALVLKQLCGIRDLMSLRRQAGIGGLRGRDGLGGVRAAGCRARRRRRRGALHRRRHVVHHVLRAFDNGGRKLLEPRLQVCQLPLHLLPHHWSRGGHLGTALLRQGGRELSR